MLDPMIAQGLRPTVQLDDPLNKLAQMMQIRQAQQQNQLGDITMQQHQQTLGEQNRLRDFFGAGNVDLNSPEAQQRMLQIAPTAAPGIIKSFADTRKTVADTGLANAHAGAYGAEQAAKELSTRISKAEQAIKDVAAFSSPQEALADLDRHVQSGEIDPAKAASIRASMPTNPADFSAWQIRTLRGIMSAKDQLALMVPSADAVLTDSRVRSEGNKNRAQAQAHFDAGQSAPEYMQTDNGLVMLPKRLAPGQLPTGQPVTGADGQPLGKPLRDIPASINTAIIANSQNLQKAKAALALVEGQNLGEMKGDKEATGWKGYLPGAILNRVDSSGVDTRAAIADLGSMVLHDRSGAAITASEYPRLQPFIPTATDDAVTVAKKLKRFIQVYEAENQAMGDVYSKAQGYRPSPLTGGAAAPSGAPDIHAQADAILRGIK